MTCGGLLAKLLVAGACALLAADSLRAEVPDNPLRARSAAMGSPTRRWQTVPEDSVLSTPPAVSPDLLRVARAWQEDAPDPQVRLVGVSEELPAVAGETVVPQQFGQRRPLAADEAYPVDGDVVYEDWPSHAPAFHRFRWLRVPQPFGHSDPNDPYRHYGLGEPLIGTSWRNRPWYFGLFVGGILNDDLIDGRVLQNNSTFLGFRLGWDFDHYWGLEARYGFARAETLNVAGTPLPEKARDYYGDVSLMYYPWGDSRWRPYLSAGLGFVNYRFEDDLGNAIDDMSLGIPLGVGLKYYYCNWFTIRFDVVNNISVGSHVVDAMDSVSLMAGAEFRFGGRSPSYFPWHGNTSYW